MKRELLLRSYSRNFLPPCGGGRRWGVDFHAAHPHPNLPPSRGKGFWQRTLIGGVGIFLGTLQVSLHATSIKVYGLTAQADLSGQSPVTPSFQVSLCDTFRPTQCGLAQLNWTRIYDDGAGNVWNPRDGTMNRQGWMYSDQVIRIAGVDVNDPRWGLHIYTNNLNQVPIYQGPLIDTPNPVNGLVSLDGQYLIPLSWRLITDQPLLISEATPPADEVMGGGQCGRSSQGFCDFATHYMADYGDRDPNSPESQRWTWWQRVSNPTYRAIQRNYQSLLTSDGAAISEGYRLPYPTYAPIPFYVYIGAHFEPGTMRAHYKTTIFLEIVSE